MRYPFRIAGFALSMLPWLVGCSQPPSYTLPEAASNLSISPVFELLPGKTSTDKVQVVVDQAGLAHVIIASGKLKSVHHVLVGPEGVIQRQIIQSSISPYAIDAAFDKEGLLHVLINDSHFNYIDGNWQRQIRTPWQEAGCKADLCRFVRGGPDLIWAFNVKGGEVGASGRWDLYGFGGYGAGLIWPWYSQVSKRVIVPQISPSYSRWFVLDPASKKDINNFRAAANASGTVVAAFDAASYGLAGVSEPAFVHFSCDGRSADSPEAPASQRRLETVSRQALPGPYDRYGLGSQCTLAMDPNSDYALLLKGHSVSWLIQDGRCSKTIPLPIKTFWEPRLAPAGNQRFHATTAGEGHKQQTEKGFPILYLEFSDGQWSRPVELGAASVSSPWGLVWDAIQIGSKGPHALVVWPTKKGIVGRWIQMNQLSQTSAQDRQD
jgi:hypothetical protein